MRNRTVQLNIRLTEAESNLLKRNCRKAGLTASGYIRMLIGGYVPKETPPIAYDELMRSLPELNTRISRSGIEADELHKFVLQLQAASTLPEPISKLD